MKKFHYAVEQARLEEQKLRQANLSSPDFVYYRAKELLNYYHE